MLNGVFVISITKQKEKNQNFKLNLFDLRLSKVLRVDEIVIRVFGFKMRDHVTQLT